MEYLENRELSWLKFNSRVLEEAGDPETPLLERLSFSAIYQSNLDEFFMVRVGSVTAMEKSGKKKKDSKTGMTPSRQLDAIFTAVKRLQTPVEDTYRSTMTELRRYGFEHVSFSTATSEELTFLELYFKREIKPFLSGTVINSELPFPFLKNKELYIAVQLSSKKGVSVGILPASHEQGERTIPLGNGGKRFILEEEVILHFAHLMFKGYRVLDRAIIRVTRNADIMAQGKGSDFRERMEELVAQRKKLPPVRLEISDEFSREALDCICRKLKIKNVRVFKSGIPLDLSFVYHLQELSDAPELHYRPLTPRKPSVLADNRTVFSQVKGKDILLSYPFESMTASFIRLLQESAVDPKVTSIKITLYRLAKNSKVIDALCTASENGKEVLVMIELRARFDEANNIYWSRVLQQSGVKVIYGPKNYKAHSKLLLIKRKSTGNGVDSLTQVGTGNYNEKTASLYTDMMLLTCNKEIAEDAERVFKALESGTTVTYTNKLLVAPNCLRNRILELMDEQISISKSGGQGYIGAKINALTDDVIINKLIEASKAGVKIELVVRGICCLIAGVSGYTENISVRSIVGRFLEHSRIYIFGNEHKEQKIYIGSADYMSRNTIKRVEVAVPVEDEKLKKRIHDMFAVLMADNVKARIMMNDGTYRKVVKDSNEPAINSQEYFYQEAYKKLEDKKARQEQLRINREKSKKTTRSKK